MEVLRMMVVYLWVPNGFMAELSFQPWSLSHGIKNTGKSFQDMTSCSRQGFPTKECPSENDDPLFSLLLRLSLKCNMILYHKIIFKICNFSLNIKKKKIDSECRHALMAIKICNILFKGHQFYFARTHSLPFPLSSSFLILIKLFLFHNNIHLRECWVSLKEQVKQQKQHKDKPTHPSLI